MTADNASLVASLDALRTDLLSSRAAASVDASALTTRLRDCSERMRDCSQDEALEAARDADLQASHCLPLLRRAAMDDPNDETGLAAAASALINTLSGSGTHTCCFSPSASLQLRLLYTPQATGTHGRIWRAEYAVAGAFVDGWSGFNVAGATVVEIGCGTAGAGLTCASLGASSVVVTDVDPGALELARSNAERNGLTNVEVRQLDMMNLPPEGSDDARFEYVIAADVPFDFVEPRCLVAALARLLAHTPSARAIVVQDGDTSRSRTHQDGIRECIALASAHPELRVVASEERIVTAAEHGLEGESTVMHVHAYSSAFEAVPAPPAES